LLSTAQEYLVSPDAKEKVHLSHEQFYSELLNEIKCLIGAAHNRHINSPYFDFGYAGAFEEFQQEKIIGSSEPLDDGNNFAVNYEECTNANQKELCGVGLRDPVE
jgi:hypothetical protein